MSCGIIWRLLDRPCDIYQERLVESWNPDYTGENAIQNQTESVTNMLPPNLYEQVINTALKRKLSVIPHARKSIVPIDKAEASKILL